MSRSFKKKPFACVYYHFTSNKWSKKHANRIFRKQNKIRLKTQRNLLYKVREIADNYDFLSDGPLIYIHKHWYNIYQKLALHKKNVMNCITKYLENENQH